MRGGKRKHHRIKAGGSTLPSPGAASSKTSTKQPPKSKFPRGGEKRHFSWLSPTPVRTGEGGQTRWVVLVPPCCRGMGSPTAFIWVQIPLCPPRGHFHENILGPGHGSALPVPSLRLKQGRNFQRRVFMGTLKVSALGSCVGGKQNNEGHSLLQVRESGWSGK